MGAKSLALAIALCSAATISAHAADPRTSENAATQAPAVDGLNFKLDVFGGTDRKSVV